jgi:hypothetical protein
MTHLCPCSLFSVSLSFYSSKYAVLTLEFLKYSWMHPCTDIGSWSSATTFRVGDKEIVLHCVCNCVSSNFKFFFY